MEYRFLLHLNRKSETMKIQINKPCHENWDAMTPNEKGAFCSLCKKNVVDFTQKTIGEIKDFFTETPQSEKVCGRFEETQLQALTFDHFFDQFKSWKLVKKAALIVFFIFGFSLFGCAQSRPEPKPDIVMGAVAYVPPKDTVKTVCKKDTVHYPIKGKVKITPDRPKPKKQQPRPPEIMGDVMVEDNRK